MPLFVYVLEPIVPRTQKEPIVPQHLTYLEQLARNNKLVCSGPFADKSGGLVCIQADSLEEATSIAKNDPFVVNAVDKVVFVKEWKGTFHAAPSTQVTSKPHQEANDR